MKKKDASDEKQKERKHRGYVFVRKPMKKGMYVVIACVFATAVCMVFFFGLSHERNRGFGKFVSEENSDTVGIDDTIKEAGETVMPDDAVKEARDTVVPDDTVKEAGETVMHSDAAKETDDTVISKDASHESLDSAISDRGSKNAGNKLATNDKTQDEAIAAGIQNNVIESSTIQEEPPAEGTLKQEVLVLEEGTAVEEDTQQYEVSDAAPMDGTTMGNQTFHVTWDEAIGDWVGAWE